MVVVVVISWRDLAHHQLLVAAFTMQISATWVLDIEFVWLSLV